MTHPGELRYGHGGRIGIGTPQANPTVEAEFAILLPRACSLHVTRLTSAAPEPEQRLRDYLTGLDGYLAAFDTLRPGVFGFACTGSSYLLGHDEEGRILAAAAKRHGYPVESAARAITWGLRRIQAHRIAIIAPYPEPLVSAAQGYWSAADIDVVQVERLETPTSDTRGIYELDSSLIAPVLHRLRPESVDAVLISGTGLPSLPALKNASFGKPLLSSNLCLAARLIAMLGHEDWLEPGSLSIRGWQRRLDEALSLNPAPGPS